MKPENMQLRKPVSSAGRGYSGLFLLLLLLTTPAWGYDLSFNSNSFAISGQHYVLDGETGALTLDGITAQCAKNPQEPLPAETAIALQLRRGDNLVKSTTLKLDRRAWVFNAKLGLWLQAINCTFTLPPTGMPGGMLSRTCTADNYNFRLTLTAADGGEANLANNTITSDDFRYTVYSRTLRFGTTETRLASLTFSGELYHIYPRYYPVLGSSAATWNGGFGELPFNAAGLAVMAQDIALGYATDLVVVHGEVVFNDLSRPGIGGLTVQVSRTVLNPAGISDTPPLLRLPPGHSVHYPTAAGNIPAAGHAAIAFPAGSHSGSHLYVDFPALALHGPGLPFYLMLPPHSHIDILNGESLELPDARPIYVHQAAEARLAADDSRRLSGLPSNDIMCRHGIPANLRIDSEGLDGTLTFTGNQLDGAGQSIAFPRGKLQFSGCTMVLQHSRISPGSGLSEPLFELTLAAGCPGSSCGAEAPEQQLCVTSGAAGILPNGAVGARFTQLHGQTPDTPAPVLGWGSFQPAPGGGLTSTFSRNDKSPGVWLIPGFIIPHHEAISDHDITATLLGSVTFSSPRQPAALHPLGAADDPAAASGDGFFAGLNLGPEEFTTTTAGIGALLNGTLNLRFAGQSDPVLMGDRPQSKYVIRPGGITGVFNTDFRGEASVYGYNLDFSRFAFRQTGNRIDQQTRIAGELVLHGRVGGDQGMRVGFSRLELTCSGDLGTACLDTEPEPTWPDCRDDNDGDGRENEGCQLLDYWQVPILMTGMAFVDDPEADSPGSGCPTAPRLLQLQTLDAIDKLDHPLEMTAAYTPAGELAHQRLTGASATILDRPASGDHPGFALRLRRAYLSQPGATPPEHGFAVLAGAVDVPLFNDIEVMLHIDNRDPAQRADGLLFVFDDDSDRDLDQNGIPDASVYLGMDVAAYRQLLHDNDIREQPRPRLEYLWPSPAAGLLDLSYYGKFLGSSLNQSPRFIGLKEELNLFNVIKLASVPDFITPERIKFSFGASADFDAMKAAFAEIGNHIDGLNLFLAGLGVAADLNLEGLLAPMVESLQDLQELAGGDLGRRLQGILETPLQAEPMRSQIAAAADALNAAHQELLALESGFKAPLLTLQSQLVTTLETTFGDPAWIDDCAAVALYGPENLAGISGIPATFDLEAAASRVRQFRSGLDRGLQEVENLLSLMVSTLRSIDGDGTALGTLARIKDKIHIAKNALLVLRRLLPDPRVYGPFLSNNAGNPIFVTISLAKMSVRQCRRQVQAFDIGRVISAIVAAADYAGVELSEDQLKYSRKKLDAIQRGISDQLDNLDHQIARAEEEVGATLDTIYGSEQFALLKKLNNGYDGLLDDSGILLRKLVTAEKAITGLETRITYLREKAPTRLEQIRPILAMLRDLTAENRTPPEGADWELCLTLSRKRFDSAAREFNQVFGQKNLSRCAGGDDPGACFKAVFGPDVVTLAQWLTEPLLADLGDDAGPGLESFFAEIKASVLEALPLPDPDDIERMIVTAIMNNAAIQQLNQAFYALYSPIREKLNDVATQVTKIVNEAITDLTCAVNQALGDKLAKLTRMGPEGQGVNPLAALAAARTNGFAVCGQDEIERIHLDFEFRLEPDPKQPLSFFTALDVMAWSAANGKSGCSEGVAGDYYDVKISTRDVSAKMLGGDVGIKQAMFGLTIAGTPPADFPLQISPCPVGIFGYLYTLGKIDFKAMTLQDLGLDCGFGTSEAYLGATGRGSFDSFSVPMAAFYLGRSCDPEVIKRLDAQVGKFIRLPAGQPLEGAYFRGGVEIPLYSYGCLCEIGAGIDVGGWLFTEPAGIYGGLLGGSLFGRLGCIGCLKGKILCMLEPAADKTKYSGTAWAAAGAGFCTPANWFTIDDVRTDGGPLCRTVDATFGVTYIDGFELERPKINCCQ